MTYHSPISRTLPDCATRLMRALQRKAGPDATVECHRTEAWASGLFLGRRYTFSLRLNGEGSSEHMHMLMRTQPDAEFEISGHIVADLAVERHSETDDGGHLLHLSILTIAEC